MRFLLDHDVPDDIVFTLDALGHEVARLREVAPAALAEQSPHPGIIVLIRRRSRALERAALVGLLDKAGESGIRRNVNFA